METQEFGKTLGRLVVLGALVVFLLTGFGLPAQARDKSGVLKASELIGMSVQGTDGKKLGDIKDLVIDPEEGGVEYAVLEFGGFAGIGDKYLCRTVGSTAAGSNEQKTFAGCTQKRTKECAGL